jgi:aryl-alcohol dehydrogenase-like predicted oxidoreductase
VKTRLLGGTTGPLVSAVGLGCNNFGQRLDLPQSRAVIEAALDAGITFFDTADVYAGGDSERILGEVLASRRHQVVIATKFGWASTDDTAPGRRSSIFASVDASLRRLRTDHVDLYQLHRPDPATPWDETLGALDELVRSGKVLHIGASNLDGSQIAHAQQAAGEGRTASFITQQNEYSLLRRAAEEDVLPATAAHGMGFLPYFPLANGLLSGKYSSGEPLPTGARLSAPGRWQSQYVTAEHLATVAALSAFAAQCGRSLLELAFAWLLSQAPVASVIAGATSAAQVRQNAAAAGWQLNAQALRELDRIAPRRPA